VYESHAKFTCYTEKQTITKKIIFGGVVYNTEQVRAFVLDIEDAYFCVVYPEEHVIERLLLENLDVHF
jgi:hypothetical protein